MATRPRNRRVEIGPRTNRALLSRQEKFGESADQIVARALEMPQRTGSPGGRGTSSKRITLSADVYEALEWQARFGELAADTLHRILRDGPRSYPRRQSRRSQARGESAGARNPAPRVQRHEDRSKGRSHFENSSTQVSSGTVKYSRFATKKRSGGSASRPAFPEDISSTKVGNTRSPHWETSFCLRRLSD